MSCYKNLECVGTPRKSSYYVVECCDEAFKNLKNIVKMYNLPLKIDVFDTLIVNNQRNNIGDFAITKDGESLIYISQLGKFLKYIESCFIHEYGHFIHYNLQLKYGKDKVDNLIMLINGSLNSSIVYKELCKKNQELISTFKYDNQADEIFARILESLYCRLQSLNSVSKIKFLYSLDDCFLFLNTLYKELN